MTPQRISTEPELRDLDNVIRLQIEEAERASAEMPGWARRNREAQHIAVGDLRRAAEAVDALWDEPDAGTEDARDGLIWVTNDEREMAAALRELRDALRAVPA